jgi:hypothetical protein
MTGSNLLHVLGNLVRHSLRDRDLPDDWVERSHNIVQEWISPERNHSARFTKAHKLVHSQGEPISRDIRSPILNTRPAHIRTLALGYNKIPQIHLE